MGGQPQLWLWDRQADTFRTACDDPVCVWMGFEGVHWTLDGQVLAVKLRAPNWSPPADLRTEAPSAQRDVWVSPSEGGARPRADEGWRSYDACRGDIATVQTRSGKVLRLATGIYPFGVQVSPDGRHIAVLCFAALLAEPDGNTALFDLHLLALDGSVHRVLADRVPTRSGTAFSWSPGSDEIAYTTYQRGSGRLVVVALDGTERLAAGGERPCLGHDDGYPPLWSADGSAIYCTAGGVIYAVACGTGVVSHLTDGLTKAAVGIVHPLGQGTVCEPAGPGSLVIIARDQATVRDGLYRLADSQFTELVPEGDRSLMNLALYGDAQAAWLVGAIEDTANPPDLFAISGVTGEERRLTRLNPHIDTVQPGPQLLISYQGPQGEPLRASLRLPPDHQPGSRHPTILHLYYGLLNSQYINLYDPDAAWLVGKGYAVLVPDMPASEEGPAARSAALALAAADAVVAQGYADPDRLGVMGGSLGGYTVCCVVTRTYRFRAAVAMASFCNLVSYALYVKGNVLLGVPWVEGGKLRLGTTLWDDPALYLENAPILRLNHVQTPLLLLHGTADKACPIQQAEEMYGGLLRLGKTATLVRYHGAGHVLTESSTDHYTDLQSRVLAWFDRYGCGR